MSIPEPVSVVYGEPPRVIATTDLRQARVDIVMLGDHVVNGQKTTLRLKSIVGESFSR